MAEDGYARYMVKGSSIILGVGALVAVAGLVTRVLLARGFTVMDYGVFFSVLSFILIFMGIIPLVTGIALPKYIAEFRVKERLNDLKSLILTAFAIQIVLTVAVSGILVASSGWLAEHYFGFSNVKLIYLILIGFFASVAMLGFLRSVFLGFRDISGYSGAKLFRWVFILGLAALFTLVLGTELVNIGIAYLLGAVLSATLMCYLLLNRHGALLSGEGNIDRSLAKKLLMFGVPIMLSVVFVRAIPRFDFVLISKLWSVEGLGLFNVAESFLGFFKLIGIAVGVPLMPLVSELWAKGEKEAIRSALGALAKFSALLLVPVALTFLVCPEFLIGLVFGSEYLAAATTLQILTVGAVFLIGACILGSILVGTGHQWRLLASALAGLALSSFAKSLLAPSLGAGGVAVVIAVSYLTVFISALYFVRGVVGFSIPSKGWLGVLTGSGLVLSLIFFLNSALPLPTWIEFITTLTTAFLLNMIWVFKIEILTSEDLALIRRATPIPRRITDGIEDKLCRK